MPKQAEKKIEIAVLRGPSHVLYNHVHVLAFDMYVGIGCVYDYECDSASKEAYRYKYVSTCADIWIGGDKLQCNHVHGVRVDDMRVQCRYTCSSEYPEKCPEIGILVLIFNFFLGRASDPADWGPLWGHDTSDNPWPPHFKSGSGAPDIGE